MKVDVLESYPGELQEPGAREKLHKAVEAVEETCWCCDQPLSKAKHRGGELQAVEDLTQRMTRLYKERTEELIKAVTEAYGRVPKSTD